MYKVTWKVDEKTEISWDTSIGGVESVLVNGKEVYNQRVFKFSNDIGFPLDDGRYCRITVVASGFSPEVELTVNNELMVPTNVEVDRTCTSCKNENEPNDKFCNSCGIELVSKKLIITKEKVKGASNTILGLAALFLISGLIMFALQYKTYNTAMENLSTFQATDIFPHEVNGQTLTVGELRTQVKIEAFGILVVNVILSLIMIGLSFWAKKTPLSAILVATGVYATVIVGNGIVDPKSLAQGVFIKILIISLLYKGIKAALELRKINA